MPRLSNAVGLALFFACASATHAPHMQIETLSQPTVKSNESFLMTAEFEPTLSLHPDLTPPPAVPLRVPWLKPVNNLLLKRLAVTLLAAVASCLYWEKRRRRWVCGCLPLAVGGAALAAWGLHGLQPASICAVTTACWYQACQLHPYALTRHLTNSWTKTNNPTTWGDHIGHGCNLHHA